MVIGADRGDPAAGFMPDDPGERDFAVSSAQRTQVGAAESAGQHFQQQARVGNFGPWDFFHSEVHGRAYDNGVHC
jgi:hypothetical protein